MISLFFKKIFDSSALHDAIRKKDEKKALGLIQDKFQLNFIYLGYTPLQLSLIYNMYKCTLALLENEIEINPNEFYKKSENEKTIQPHVTGEDVCNVKLLALYGANTEGIKFTIANIYLKKLITDMHNLYEQRKEWEKSLDKNIYVSEKISLNKKLSILWHSVSENEKNSTYKNFYLSKTEMYNNRIKKLISTQTTEPNTPESEADSIENFSDEKKFLLSKKTKIL